MDFSLLPLEIKFHIFTYLTDEELRDKVYPISKEWRELARDPFHRTKLEIDYWQYPEKLQLLAKYNRIRKLKLCSVNHRDWITTMPKYNLLREFRLRYCPLSSTDAAYQLLQRVPLIRKLEFTACKIDNNDCISKIPPCRKLNSILIARMHRRQYHACTCVEPFVENCEKLGEIDLETTSIPDNTLLKLTKLRGANLTKLIMCGSNLVDVGYKSLIKCCRLTTLIINHANNLSTEGLTSIRTLNNLLHLEVSMSNEGLVHLFQDASFHNLNVLRLRSVPFLHDQALQSMADCCPLLRELCLSDCLHLSDDGLMPVVNKCKRLERIMLSGLYAFRGTPLMEIDVRLPKLKYLALKNCSIRLNVHLYLGNLARQKSIVYEVNNQLMV